MRNYRHKSLEEKKQECIDILRSTGRDGIDKLISHIDRMGYFIAPGSYRHHRFEGGLVSHSLELYHKAMRYREEKIAKGVDPGLMPVESVAIAALMHDLCKADCLRFNKDTQAVYSIKKGRRGHGSRSVRKVRESGFVLTPAEADAIFWHMGGRSFQPNRHLRHQHLREHPLSGIINKADGSSIGDSKRRHHGGVEN